VTALSTQRMRKELDELITSLLRPEAGLAGLAIASLFGAVLRGGPMQSGAGRGFPRGADPPPWRGPV